MKLKLIPFIALLTLCGCQNNKDTLNRDNNNVSQVVLTKESTTYNQFEYEAELNRDNILFSRNYTINIFYDGSLEMTTSLDNGNISTFVAGNSFPYYFNVEAISEEQAILTKYYLRDGVYSKDSSVVDRPYLYRFFFYSFNFLFQVPYSSIEYDEETYNYKILPTTVDDVEIRGGTISIRNKQPSLIEAYYGQNHSIKLSFTSIGTTSVSMPRV